MKLPKYNLCDNTRDRDIVGGWAGGHVLPPNVGNFREIFGNFKALYQLRVCVMTSCDLNVTVRRKNIKLCPPFESLPTTPLTRDHWLKTPVTENNNFLINWLLSCSSLLTFHRLYWNFNRASPTKFIGHVGRNLRILPSNTNSEYTFWVMASRSSLTVR